MDLRPESDPEKAHMLNSNNNHTVKAAKTASDPCNYYQLSQLNFKVTLKLSMCYTLGTKIYFTSLWILYTV